MFELEDQEILSHGPRSQTNYPEARIHQWYTIAKEVAMVAARSARRIGLVIAGILVAAVALSGCGRQGFNAATPTPGETSTTMAFDLYTHCGISGLKVNDRYFQHVGGSLDDGSGNPPGGWGNPYQHGTLTVSGDLAIFRDDRGHVEKFEVRSGVSGPPFICS